MLKINSKIKIFKKTFLCYLFPSPLLPEEQIEQFKLEKSGLQGQLNVLTSQVESLESQKINLNGVEAELAAKKVDLDSLRTRIQELQTQSQEIEHRGAELEFVRTTYDGIVSQKQNFEERINQLKPQIDRLESEKQRILQTIQDNQNEYHKVEVLRRSQVEFLESQKININNIESEIATKNVDLDSLTTKIQELQTQSQQRTSELEFLRITYDGIFNQKESFEERVNQLRPEIDSLETEKQRILQAIQENQNEYHKIEELRQKLHELKIAIRDKKSELRELEREIEHLQGIKAALEENNAKLGQKKEELQEEIRRFKGEITEIENSAKLALQSLREKLWTELPNNKLQLEEKEFITGFIHSIKSQGLTFSERVINAFHTSLKVQDISALVILAGISGTGKSELPQRYSHYIGAQLLTLAVQPRWDSPQDLQGFYNYVEKKFKPTDLMRGLYQYNKDSEMEDRIVIVLLDEMNLARVEYYFSEFLSKLESRRNHATYLEIDVGSLRINENERRLQIPNAFLFVGTMNEDETTQTLSDKVLDRANVLTFGKPQNLKLRQENQIMSSNNQPSEYLPYSYFKRWIIVPDPNSEVVKKVKYFLNEANEVMEKIGHPFAHRVYQAITQYVVNYPGVDNIDAPAFKFALADQFGQKLLPKLRGVMVDESQQELDELEKIISDIDDKPLITAFQKARKGHYGQFSWQGLVYEDKQA
ncbi:AAA family ATPase [Dolichospermum sp. ST_sed10]|nr:AAA family ATPase [Dolichospermum sp. ST_sed10]